MTRRDYELTAQVIKHCVEVADGLSGTSSTAIAGKRFTDLALNYVANSLASAYQSDNPRFDRDQFLTNCGISPWKDNQS